MRRCGNPGLYPRNRAEDRVHEVHQCSLTSASRTYWGKPRKLRDNFYNGWHTRCVTKVRKVSVISVWIFYYVYQKIATVQYQLIGRTRQMMSIRLLPRPILSERRGLVTTAGGDSRAAGRLRASKTKVNSQSYSPSESGWGVSTSGAVSRISSDTESLVSKAKRCGLTHRGFAPSVGRTSYTFFGLFTERTIDGPAW